MSIPKNLIRDFPELNKWSILMGYRGSIAHEMYIPNSQPDSIDDKDVMNICIPPIDYYFGLKEYGSRGTKEMKQQEWDIVNYELIKFIRLLKKSNPNVLSMLWLKPQYYLYKTDIGEKLIKNRDLFVSKQAYFSFVGYAHGQLHRMEHLEYRGFMGEKRKRLVDKYGYDTKNAAHLIRLLRMGIEYLNTGELIVARYDNNDLLNIKRGMWTLDHIKAEAAILFKEANSTFLKSHLPYDVDSEKINIFTKDLILEYFSLTIKI